jgi:hypothetical protein
MTGITKETFTRADIETQMGILYDYHRDTSEGIKDIQTLLQKHPSDCEKRFVALETRKIKDTAISGGMGLLGGFLTMAAKLKFWG